MICALVMLQMAVSYSSFGQQPDLFEAFKDGKAGLIDKEGAWVLKPRFDSIDYVDDHRVYFYKDSLMGIANLSGRILVQPRWKELFSDEYGLVMARDEKGTTYIKAHNGKRICGYYKDVSLFENGLLVVRDSSDKWGAIDRYGVRMIPCGYDSLEDFENDRARAWLAGKSLFIDKDGREVEALEHYGRWRSSEGSHIFRRGDKWGAVNSRGDTVFQPVYDYLSWQIFNNARVFCKDGKCGVADTLGNITVVPQYDYLRELYIGHANVACLGGKWGAVDGKCEPVIPFVFDALHELRYGRYFAASQEGRWGI